MAAKSMEDIAKQLKAVRFRRRLFGGVNEDDVWRVIENLQREYAAVLDAQQQWYEALLTERGERFAPQQPMAPYPNAPYADYRRAAPHDGW